LATVKVREAIRRLQEDGWYLARTVGSHRHYRHPTKPGTVTVPGRPNDTLKEGTWKSIQRQAGWR
jgi:predicted RNA binding protein YcfA (HicA-like mRNA interferase family)